MKQGDELYMKTIHPFVFHLFEEIPEGYDDKEIEDIEELIHSLNYTDDFNDQIDNLYFVNFATSSKLHPNEKSFQHLFKTGSNALPPLMKIDTSFKHPHFIKIITSKEMITNFLNVYLNLKKDIINLEEEALKNQNKFPTITKAPTINNEVISSIYHELVTNDLQYGVVSVYINEGDLINEGYFTNNEFLNYIIRTYQENNIYEYYICKTLGEYE